MCVWNDTVPVLVLVDGRMSASGKTRWKKKQIDRCIAPIVEALSKGGVRMLATCCGHYKRQGRIDLVDGRTLRVASF